MFKKTRYKSKILLYFVLVVLLIVSSSGVINYFNGRNLVMNNARRHAADTLIQLKNTNDLLLENIAQTLQGFAGYSDLELFAVRYPSMRDYSTKSAVFGRVSTILNLNKYFTSCYVYYPEQKSVIDVNVRTPCYEPVNENRNQQMILAVYEAYRARENGDENPLYSIVKTGGTVEWLMAIPIRHSPQAASPLLIVSIDSSYFSRSLTTLDLAEGAQVYLSDANRKWITPPPAAELQDEFLQRVETASSGEFTQSVSGTKYLVTYTVSDVYGWNYICSIPLHTVYGQVHFLMITALLAAVLCCLIGFALAKALTGRLYTPIERLSGQLRKVNAEQDSDGDVFHTMHSGVEELISQNEQLQRKLRENEKIVKNDFLSHLLKNDVELYESVYESFESYHIPFTDRMQYQVAVLSLEQNEPLRPTYEARRALWLKMLDFDQTLKAAFSTLSDFHLETVALAEDSLVIILGFEEACTEREMADLLAALQRDAQDRLACPVTLGHSGLSRNVSKIPVLYQQAQAALEHQFFSGTSRSISFAELPEAVAEDYRYPWNIEKVVLSNLRQGQLEEVCKGVGDFAQYIQSHIRNTEKSRMSFLHLCTDILRAAEELVPETVGEFSRESLHQGILSSTCSADIVALLKDYCATLCAAINRRKDEHNNDIAQSALAFLEKNYADPGLDLEALSRELSFSVSYISKMFKTSTGISIKEYIIQKRINLACDMLRVTDKKVWEISAAVGYDQQHSFIEIFKKYKGMTPSEYRKRREGEP